MMRVYLYRLRRHRWARELYGGHWEHWNMSGPGPNDDWFVAARCINDGGEFPPDALMLLACEDYTDLEKSPDKSSTSGESTL
jgi:hypothetical protein